VFDVALAHETVRIVRLLGEGSRKVERLDSTNPMWFNTCTY